MNTNTSLDAKTTEMLMKFRKGADAAFGVGDLVKVLAMLPGWKAELAHEKRTVVTMIVTAPNGESVREDKEPQYKRLTIGYRILPFCRKHGFRDAVSALLGLPSYEAEQADKNIYGVHVDLNHAGTCPVCFRVQKLEPNDTLVKHGYTRPGDGYIHGNCYGVGLKPLEVSAEGTQEYWSEVMEPSALASEAAWARFQVSPPTTLVITKTEGYGKNRVETKVTVDATTCEAWDTERQWPGTEFNKALENLARRLERDAKDDRRLADAYKAVVANWVSDITPIQRREAKVHAKMLPFIMKCC